MNIRKEVMRAVNGKIEEAQKSLNAELKMLHEKKRDEIRKHVSESIARIKEILQNIKDFRINKENIHKTHVAEATKRHVNSVLSKFI